MTQLNVCVLLDAFDHVSGINTTYRSMLRLAPQAGVNLTLITTAAHGQTPHPNGDPFAPLRVPSKFSVHFPIARSIRIDWPNYRALRAAVEAAEPDLIHAVTPGPVGIYAVRLGKQLGLPVVGYYHTDYLSMQKPNVLSASMAYPIAWGVSKITTPFVAYTERKFYAPCDAVCCEAPKTIRQVLDRHLNDNPVLVPPTLRHDLDPAAADPDGFRARYGLVADQPVALFLGRFAPDKNVPLVATAAERCPEITFVAVGEGPLEPLLAGRPNVIVTGRLDGVDVCSAYAAADVLIMPSWEETFGLVSLEAMAIGLPVITADTAGSAPEVLEAGAGVAFSPYDPDAFLRLLRETLRDSTALAAMRQNALAWAEHNQPLDRYRSFVAVAYHPLLAKHATGRHT